MPKKGKAKAKKKKKRSKSQKGPGFERGFCKRLSLWWSGHKRDDIFWRTAGSGARATARAKKGLRTADSYGDVKAEHILGKPLTMKSVFSLKRGYTGKKGKKSLKWASLLDLIDNPSTTKGVPAIAKWWEELLTLQVQSKRKNAFLVFKRDRKKELIGMAPSVLAKIEQLSGEYKGEYVMTKSGLTIMILMPVENFFAWCKPESLGRNMRQIKRRKR